MSECAVRGKDVEGQDVTGFSCLPPQIDGRHRLNGWAINRVDGSRARKGTDLTSILGGANQCSTNEAGVNGIEGFKKAGPLCLVLTLCTGSDPHSDALCDIIHPHHF